MLILSMISNPQLLNTPQIGERRIYVETDFWTTSMDVNTEDILDSKEEEHVVYCATLLLLG